MPNLLSVEQVTKETYDELATTWTAECNGAGYWTAEMQRFHELLPEGNLLEIGAGGGRDAKELVALGYGYTGTDISSGILQEARAFLPSHEFHEKSVYELDSLDTTFDGFWACAVLLHIPKTRIHEALQQVKSVVRARGIGFISIQDGNNEGMQTTDIRGEKFERFFAYWQKGDFEDVLQDNQMNVVDYMCHPMSETKRWHGFFVET